LLPSLPTRLAARTTPASMDDHDRPRVGHRRGHGAFSLPIGVHKPRPCAEPRLRQRAVATLVDGTRTF
jgi:hypothetical protein